MINLAELFSARDLWLLQTFTQCHLATEETLEARILVYNEVWATDFGGNASVRHTWYPCGQMAKRIHLDKFKRIHGLIEIWNPSGEIWRRKPYKHGRKHGAAKEWVDWYIPLRCDYEKRVITKEYRDGIRISQTMNVCSHLNS